MWCAIILAGGSGVRMGAGRNKVLLPVGGAPAIVRSARAFAPLTDGLVVVARREDLPDIRDLLAEARLDATVVPGGATRQASVWSGLNALPGDCGRVLIHDGARCLVNEGVIRRVMDAVETDGAAAAAMPVSDTIRKAEGGLAAGMLDRASLRAMQTPQGFDVPLIRRAHEAARRDGFLGTDDAALVERLGVPVRLTEGSRRNLKLTTPEDIIMAEAFLQADAPLPALRVGQGYDVHKLVEGRDLILCGVKVPHTLGLLGHSDADVALHALMDAMLGAAALGDIGQHFPDSDERYRGISSMTLLRHVTKLLADHGLRVANADVTIVAQRPKLMPFLPEMRQNIADVLTLPVDRVSVKATTTERLGFEGREEGISAQAVCLLSPLQEKH